MNRHCKRWLCILFSTLLFSLILLSPGPAALAHEKPCETASLPRQERTPPQAHSMSSSQEKAVLTTSWENVGGGRVNRKYLNGLIAFCLDEEMKFPDGATYLYVTATDAVFTGQAAAIVERYGQSGVDNAQWWNQCQVAIWAIQAGCLDQAGAADFARSYCADRRITDAAVVDDYAYIVGSLVEDSRGRSGTAYLYAAEDPANQRIVTFTPVWPDETPAYPDPQYDTVTAKESRTVSCTHTISIDNKYAAITGESLAGAVFEVWEGDVLAGTITTDDDGKGSLRWTIAETASAVITETYCSNYDQLDPTLQETIAGYTNRQQAEAAARKEAGRQAQELAQAAADAPRTVTVLEITVPEGFLPTEDSRQTLPLTGEDSAAISVKNIPWSARLLIDKVDGDTGAPIPDDAAFVLYEWNGSTYEINPHYEILRREDGTYTAQANHPDALEGYLYYTQTNQGRFGLAEVTAPDGYLADREIFYFQITEPDQLIYGRNASPEDYPIDDHTKFANLPVIPPVYEEVFATETYEAVRTHQISIDSKYAAVTGESLAGAVFRICEDDVPVGTITTDADGKGSCQWNLCEAASVTVTKTYCANYDQLPEHERGQVTGFINRADALAAAREEAAAQARKMAEAAAETPRTVTVHEVSVPEGFLLTETSRQELSLAGNDQAAIQAENRPWKARVILHKTDGLSGTVIGPDAVFTLYEWDGDSYEVSPHYRILRLEAGTYTVQGSYPHAREGYLYYTQVNQGRFALGETTAPQGYLTDDEMVCFQITEDGQTIYIHNADPEKYPFGSDGTFVNMPVTGAIEIAKQGPFLTHAEPVSTDREQGFFYTGFTYTPGPVEGASFAIYAKEDILAPDQSGTVATYQGVSLVKDALVATITTGHDGIARLDGLPLGTYYIRETAAGQGEFLLNPTIMEVTLSYQDPATSVVTDGTLQYTNERQKVSLNLMKKAISQEGETLLLPGAIFGLYAAEDIVGYGLCPDTGAILSEPVVLMAAHTLVECLATDGQGLADFCSDLPYGKYYVKELAAPHGYLVNEEVLTLDASYTGQEGDAVIQLSCEFYDKPIPPTMPETPQAPLSTTGSQTGDAAGMPVCCLGIAVGLLGMWICGHSPSRPKASGRNMTGHKTS